MKATTKIKDAKKSDFEVDTWLNQFNNVVICPEKVEKAKKTIERLGLPDLKKIK